MKPAYSLRSDPLFPAAVLAGPVVWLLLYLVLQPEFDWSWPLTHPARFLWPVVFFPIVEEMVFRGLLQELIRNHLSARTLGPLSIANLLTSILFTGLHFVYQPVLLAALVFIPSLVFGFFKDRSNRLTAPIALHMFYNFGYLWVFSAPG